MLVDGLNDLVTSDLHHFPTITSKIKPTHKTVQSFIMAPLHLSVWLELEVPLPTLYKKLSKTMISNHHLNIETDFFQALWNNR